MELRLLDTESDRQIFAHHLIQARATRGIGFKETARSRLGNSHLAFGNLYALFEHEAAPPEEMVAGFIMHDLATLPQSYPQPDMSYLPARSVLEGSELWSLSPGVGRIAAAMAAAVAGILQAKAILVYPICRPVDLSLPYGRFSFVKPCDAVRFPYGETIKGEEIWVQPLLLQGEKLEEYISYGFDFLFQCAGNRRALRFDPPPAKLSQKPPLESSPSYERAIETPEIRSATVPRPLNGAAGA